MPNNRKPNYFCPSDNRPKDFFSFFGDFSYCRNILRFPCRGSDRGRKIALPPRRSSSGQLNTLPVGKRRENRFAMTGGSTGSRCRGERRRKSAPTGTGKRTERSVIRASMQAHIQARNQPGQTASWSKRDRKLSLAAICFSTVRRDQARKISPLPGGSRFGKTGP